MVMGGVLEDRFFYMLKNAFLHLIPAKTMIPTNLELLGEVGGGRPLQLCRWTYFAKSKSKQVIAKKRPKFNKKSTFYLFIFLFSSIVNFKLFFTFLSISITLLSIFQKKKNNNKKNKKKKKTVYADFWTSPSPTRNSG